jgi:NADPH:quinone reductase-like Zn-dependent oxidoreductase
MRAIVHDRYGSPDVLNLGDVEQPELAADGVLVHVRAAAINPADWYGLTGRPWIARPMMGLRTPKGHGIGIDFAGTVVAVGEDVGDLHAGDAVFGTADGALAEVVSAAKAVALKPANATFEEAAAVPVAATTALQGLRDHGALCAGQSVCVNGASGGVGTFAVQIAKALGADVTAVCSTRNVDLVRSLGADRVVDYTREDFTRSGERYDVLLDVAGSRPWRACRRVLAPGGTAVVVGGPKSNRLLGPLGHVAAMRAGAIARRQKALFFIARPSRVDLDVLRELIEAGQVRPVVDRRYDLPETAAAFAYLGEGHARGKVVVTVANGAGPTAA